MLTIFCVSTIFMGANLCVCELLSASCLRARLYKRPFQYSSDVNSHIKSKSFFTTVRDLVTKITFEEPAMTSDPTIRPILLFVQCNVFTLLRYAITNHARVWDADARLSSVLQKHSVCFVGRSKSLGCWYTLPKQVRLRERRSSDELFHDSFCWF